MKCVAAAAPVMNHLRPKMRHVLPCCSARVLIMPGSEPPPGEGSVIAKDELTLPSTIGRSHRSFCTGVPARASRFMLPSSGAMQLKASGPNSERAASSYTTAQATIGSAMPPNSLGDCGAHRPAFRAIARTGARRSAGMFSCSEKFSLSLSSGSTCSSMKARTRTRRSSISGGRVKSIMAFPSLDAGSSAAQRDHLAAVDHDGGASHVASRIRDEQQERAVEIAVLAEAADRDVAGELPAFLAAQEVAVDLGDEPAGRDGVDAHALEGELEAERLGDLHHAGLGGGVGDHALGDAEAEHRRNVDDRALPVRRQHPARAFLRPVEH